MTCKELLEIIDLDSQFLSENYLMDYSILLGIELADEKLNSRERIKNRRVVESQCGKYIYHIAIIDYL